MKYILISDIHANDIALNAVTQFVENLGDQSEMRYLFLGDLVGYGTMAGAWNCIRWLRSRSNVDWLPGNHDEWIVNQNDGSFRASALLSLLAQRTYLMQPDRRDDFSWFEKEVHDLIKKQPTFVSQVDGLTFCLTHGTVVDGGERSGYLYPWKPSLIKWDLLRLREKYPTELVSLFFGHTHYPLLSCLQGDQLVYGSIRYGEPIPLCDGMIAVNPGSVGQPRDGDPRSAFAILDTQARTIAFHRVNYDVEAIIRQLESDGNFNSRSRLYPLSWDERDAILKEMKRRGKDETPNEIYAELISSVRAGNKDCNLSLYQGVYRKVAGGLEALPS
jgi:diadenosine tetraphosphatase ApaH/serine/threonine PP2A family protein phosphatase